MANNFKSQMKWIISPFLFLFDVEPNIRHPLTADGSKYDDVNSAI